MSLFKFKKSASTPSQPAMSPGAITTNAATNVATNAAIGTNSSAGPNFSTTTTAGAATPNYSAAAEIVLNVIHDGVILTDAAGVVRFINPAAAEMVGLSSPTQAVGLDFGLIIRLEDKDGHVLPDAESPLVRAMDSNQPLEAYACRLIVGQTDKRIPISLSVLPSATQDHIITFRNITKELAESSEQAEFISTASHEMRTPVASIEGYLSLALNPQTATIDERAHGYLDAAHAASQHLGKLFQDLLDATKLDDGHIRPHFTPIEAVSFVGGIVQDYVSRATAAQLSLIFIPQSATSDHRLEQAIYGYVDVNFMREILDNLLDNALKYTPAGGSISVNVQGQSDRVLISVRDTGMGIAPSDIGHIFQKFYRADNSDTCTIGGTGLGLYLVKQRVEALGGTVWAESVVGEGSVFYISLPRLSSAEYDKYMISVRNEQMQERAHAVPQPQVQARAVPQVQAQSNAAPQAAPLQTQSQSQPSIPAQEPAQHIAMQERAQPSASPPAPILGQSNNNLNGEIK